MGAVMATTKKLTSAALRERKGGGEKIAAVTAYDVAFARLADRAGVDIVLVGDSLGMVVQGLPNTLPVTLDEMIYHSRMVARGAARAQIVADMPFLSYQTSVEDGVRSAGRLLKEGAAEAVKLGWAHGALLTTFPGDTTMATVEQVKAFAKGGSARIQR